MTALSIILALFAGVVTFIGEAFNPDGKRKVLWATLPTVVLCYLANSVWVIVTTPVYSNFWDGTIGGMLFLDLLLAATVTGLTDTVAKSGGGVITSVLATILSAVIFFVGAAGSSPGFFCDEQGNRALATLAQIKDADEAYPQTDPDQLIRVSESAAMLKASTAMGGEQNIGSYLQPNRAYLQRVQGHPYYIIDFRVSDQNAFYNSRGGIIPGYLAVDALDDTAPAVAHYSYKMRYVPGGGWSRSGDLDRYVYFNFTQNAGGVKVDDLDGLEVDDDWNPKYTGTLLSNQVSFKGKTVSGIIVVDPQTGQIDRYALDNQPAWIDRVWSESYVKDTISQWGNWNKDVSAPCSYGGNAGRRQIDDLHDVITPLGLEYQITMTSIGPDHSLTEMIYVSPTNGIARRYPLTGGTEAVVQHNIQQASHRMNSQGFNADQCQIHILLSKPVWYCILTGLGSTTVRGGSVQGVGFVQQQYATDGNKVIVEQTLREAYNKLRQQVAADQTDNPTLAEQIQKAQFSGTLDRKSILVSPSGDQNIIFTLKNDETAARLVFKVEANRPTASLMREGDQLTVTAVTVRYDDWTDVSDLVDTSLPEFVISVQQ